MPLNSQATPNNSELAGQVAVATGGGRGIGRAIVATLSEARMTTAVFARSASEIAETARMIEQAGGRARPFAADVTDAAAVGRASQEIERSLGSVTCSCSASNPRIRREGWLMRVRLGRCTPARFL